jgi:hypothetical protein
MDVEVAGWPSAFVVVAGAGLLAGSELSVAWCRRGARGGASVVRGVAGFGFADRVDELAWSAFVEHLLTTTTTTAAIRGDCCGRVAVDACDAARGRRDPYYRPRVARPNAMARRLLCCLMATDKTEVLPCTPPDP